MGHKLVEMKNVGYAKTVPASYVTSAMRNARKPLSLSNKPRNSVKSRPRKSVKILL